MVTCSFLAHNKTMKGCWFDAAVGLAVILVVAAKEKTNTFNDVRGEEGTIDLIHDFMTAQRANLGFNHNQDQIKHGDKIEFGVGPDDPRFFDPQIPPKKEAITRNKIPNLNSNDIPDSLNYPARKSFLNQYRNNPGYPQQNEVSNIIPQDPRLYQNNGPYIRPNEGMSQYEDMNEISDNLPNFANQWDKQRGNREYVNRYPNYQQHKVDLNANVHKNLHNNDALMQRQREKEQLTFTNKQYSRFNKDIHNEKTTELQDEPQASHRKMDKFSASVPGHNNAHHNDDNMQITDFTFTAIVAGCTAVAVFGVIGAGMCWYRLHKNQRATADAEYPAYGVTGPSKDLSPGAADRKLAQSAHMYHYQHQKQQMIALDKSTGGERQGSASDVDTDEEGEEGDYTVYECPGLASTGEMEVKNPLFQDEPTPATPAKNKDDHRGSPEPQDD